MKRINVDFQNKNGERLGGILQLPPDRDPHNFALFAHCFTCTKNLIAIRNISTELTRAGFGVLRFDFTGLGDSEGDFAETNFSGNVDDLVAAADFLRENYMAPSLLIGHSLGGAASIFAADRLPDVKAVATIGAPSDPVHVRHLLKEDHEEIERKGKALVDIGGRDFTIKKQFLDDLENYSMSEIVRHFKKSLLIMHSPQDRIVGIKNAEELFKAAFHPKSFVSLDGADHLLSDAQDSLYVGHVIAAWASRYVPIPAERTLKSKSRVTADLDSEDIFTTHIAAGSHSLVADEPVEVGGKDYGPSPYDYLASGLAACTAMTMQMYARHKKWDLQNVTVHIKHSREHAADCQNSEKPSAKIDTFTKEIEMHGPLSDEQRSRLMEIADRCPVHKTLSSEIRIRSEQA
ncbi:MAG: OsmC family protein [Chryseobacterium sp.]|nr:MAG: OsmC family protein [Chryseobacterium sp.]